MKPSYALVSSYDLRYVDGTDISDFASLSPVTPEMISDGSDLDPVEGGQQKVRTKYLN